MDNRSSTAVRRTTIIANAEAAAVDRLISATDAALSKLWQRYDDHELRELTASLATGRPAEVVHRFDSDLARLAGAFDGGEP